MPAQPNHSLIAGLACLQELTAAGAPVGSRELARRLGLEPTRVNRLLGTLAELGLAEQDTGRKYRPGPGVHVLAAQGLQGSPLLRAALPEVAALLATGHGVAVGVLWRDRVCYLYHGRPLAPVEAGIGGHALFPADESSIGEVMRATQAATDADSTLAAVRARGWSLKRAGTPQASLAVAIGEPPIAGLALTGGIAEAAAPDLAARLRVAAARIAAACARASGGAADAGGPAPAEAPAPRRRRR